MSHGLTLSSGKGTRKTVGGVVAGEGDTPSGRRSEDFRVTLEVSEARDGITRNWLPYGRGE